ncbi:MAG TPA: hypothetical protein VEA69_21270 [Tepidisphaeraceae bacterium]|nr:hypothetical protein [Tepidisphaeraceae bacterium]
MKFLVAAVLVATAFPALADECDECRAKAALSLAKASRERKSLATKKAGIEETSTPKAKGCPVCGPACDCRDCDCDAGSYNGRCDAAPKRPVITGTRPNPLGSAQPFSLPVIVPDLSKTRPFYAQKYAQPQMYYSPMSYGGFGRQVITGTECVGGG